MRHETPFVSHEEYMLAIQDALEADPYDPDYHDGMRNPYSGYEVTCEDDYNEYMREYVYNRLCEKVLEQEYDAKLSAKIQQLESDYRDKIDQFKKKYDDRGSMRGRLWVIASIVLALLLAYMGIFHGPAKEAAQYDAGYSSGYKYGYVRGYADSYLGDNSSSRDTSVGVTIPRAGIGFNRTVHVSRYNKMHLSPNCSGMEYYSTMKYGTACVAGYSHCQKCFQ